MLYFLPIGRKFAEGLPRQVPCCRYTDEYVALLIQHTVAKADAWTDAEARGGTVNHLCDSGNNFTLPDADAVQVRFITTHPCRIERIVVPLLHNRNGYLYTIVYGVPFRLC